MSTNKNDTNEPITEILEFLKASRTIVNQLQIMSKINMSVSEVKLTQNAASNLLENIESYIKLNQVDNQ